MLQDLRGCLICSRLHRGVHIVFLGIIFALVGFAAVGCEKDLAEEAGQKFDEAVKTLKDAAKDATD